MIGLGCVPCTNDQVELDSARHPIHRLVGSAFPGATAVDHSPLLDFVPDQGATNSCVGQWHSSAIYLAGQAQGRPVPRPSRRWSYTVSRYTADPGVPLVDRGTSAHFMCTGTERHGIVSEDRLPFEVAQINEPPPFDADIAGADAVFKGYYRADDDTGRLRRALEEGHFPGIAIAVYRNFMDCGADVYDAPGGDFIGFHMLTLIGYRPGAFRVLNSWGTGWADGGFCWMSDSFIKSKHCFDKYVITAAPTGVR